MIEFSKQISDKWNIPITLSEQLCSAFSKGDTVYYLIEYNTAIAVELSDSTIWEIFDFLKCMEDLSSKKKRVLNALRKIGPVSSDVEKHVSLTSSPFELDDMLLPLRINPRSKGQVASNKGLSALAEAFLEQKEEIISVEEMAEAYVGKDESLKTTADVIQGVKDILSEQFAYNETVRAMTREFTYDDGFLEITPKNRKDPEYADYIGKQISFNELSKEQILKLMIAENHKSVRLKVGVQLFRITELVRHHFITNPDSVGFDLLCESIDESWLRLLQPAIERDVKSRLFEEAQAWASKQLIIDLEKMYSEELTRGPLLVVNAAYDKNMLLIAVNGKGNFLGATTEKKPPEGKSFSSDRLRQFLNRHKPLKIIVIDNDQAHIALSVMNSAIAGFEQAPSIVVFSPDAVAKNVIKSEWIQKELSSLIDEEMGALYGAALQYLKPLSMISKIGTSFYTFHPLQNLVDPDKLAEILDRVVIMIELRKGVVIKEILDSKLVRLPQVTSEIIYAIRSSDAKGEILSKNDLLKVEGMTELVFRNIAGFVIIANAENILDRTIVHPDHYNVFQDMSDQFNVSIDTIVSDPDVMYSYDTDDNILKIYVQKKMIPFAAVAGRFAAVSAPKVKRKLKLNELKEGAIVSGKVTNITQFGVFININAVCDGLIHISQLADEYVETPEQVVSVNDKVDVRILKVDIKKRRISLSMKNLGTMAPKVRPSEGQLTNLADHFKNR